MPDSFISDGQEAIAKAWATADQQEGDFYKSASLASMADKVFAGAEKGYQKAVVIQATGKAANPSLDAQAMQKGKGITDSWDAREFAKQVFVPWNGNAGSPFSHASDPYVSNPYRIPRFDATVRSQRKNKAEFDSALAVLEFVNSASTADAAFDYLVEILYSLKRRIANEPVDYPLPTRASLSATLECVLAFTNQLSGGARLQAVVLALINSLSAKGMAYADILSRHVNASDKSSGAAGDISYTADQRVHAVEVKDRPLEMAELLGTVEKCRISGVQEILFVIGSKGLLASDLSEEEFGRVVERNFSTGLNVYIEQFSEFARLVLTLVGESGRRHFLEAVGAALSSQSADRRHKVDWAKQVRSI